MVNVPHISSIVGPTSVIIGSKVPVKIFISNSFSIPLNISIASSNYLDPVSTLSESNHVETELEFTPDITTGVQIIDFNVTILKTRVQNLSIDINFTPNVRIPNGLIYLIGAGILAGMVVIVRRPPEFLKRYIDELRAESAEANIAENITENITTEE